MSTEVAVKQSTDMAIPQNLAALFGGRSNLTQVDSTPSLSFKGKVFCVNLKGNHKQLLDSEDNPLPMVDVVVLGANRQRSRVYYAGTYTEGSNASPICHSFDGRFPSKDVDEPQASNCEACEFSAKGSKITENGTATSACSLRQRIAVIPSDKPDFDALLMNLASTSSYDKEEPDAAKGWYSWSGYVKQLQSRGIAHSAMCVTRIRFSANEAYPKLQFKFAGYISEDMAATVASRVESDEILNLLDKHHKDKAQQLVAIAPKPAQVAKETPVTQEPKPAAKARAKPVVVEETTKPVVVEETTKHKAPVVVDDDKDLASVLSAWE